MPGDQQEEQYWELACSRNSLCQGTKGRDRDCRWEHDARLRWGAQGTRELERTRSQGTSPALRAFAWARARNISSSSSSSNSSLLAAPEPTIGSRSKPYGVESAGPHGPWAPHGPPVLPGLHGPPEPPEPLGRPRTPCCPSGLGPHGPPCAARCSCCWRCGHIRTL